MKNINLAYYTLKDDFRRREYDALRTTRSYVRRTEEDSAQARECVAGYFDALLKNAFDEAYAYLSVYDRRYVSPESFREWRLSVNKLFVICGFSVTGGERGEYLPLDKAGHAEARLFNVMVDEKNRTDDTSGQYSVSKYAVKENGVWRVFLGYNDLNEITKTFERLVLSRDREAMEAHWEEYKREACPELGLLSLKGLMKRAEGELYRYERYRRELAAACFSVSPARTDILEVCAQVIQSAVRAADITAYAGDVVFTVLYVEMKKKYVRSITNRLALKIKKAAEQKSGFEVSVTRSFEQYRGGDLEKIIERLTGEAAGGFNR